MIVINTVNDKRFSLNGIEYLKNFLSFVAGDRLLIYNAYDRSDERCSLTLYSEFQVNGITYASVALLQSALLDVIYTRSSLGGAVVANFYQLLDTFAYAGRNGHFVRVNSVATGLESIYSNVFSDAEKSKLAGLTPFTPIALNQYGTHPAFTNQTDLNAWLLGRLTGEVVTLNVPQPISAISDGENTITINWTDTNS